MEQKNQQNWQLSDYQSLSSQQLTIEMMAAAAPPQIQLNIVDDNDADKNYEIRRNAFEIAALNFCRTNKTIEDMKAELGIFERRWEERLLKMSSKFRTARLGQLSQSQCVSQSQATGTRSSGFGSQVQAYVREDEDLPVKTRSIKRRPGPQGCRPFQVRNEKPEIADEEGEIKKESKSVDPVLTKYCRDREQHHSNSNSGEE